MIVVPNLEQGSAAWIKTRLGVLTASRAELLVTPTGKLSSQRERLLNELAFESLIGEPADEFKGNFWTERGKELEDEAASYFAVVTDLDPKAVGFVYRDESKTCGCSPDMLVPDADGNWVAGVELKCPKGSTHIGYLRNLDKDPYIQQVQFSLWVTQLPAWYFMSYYPGLRPVLKRHEPDPAWQSAFDEHVLTFLAELQQVINEQREDK